MVEQAAHDPPPQTPDTAEAGLVVGANEIW
jgi:hypothetical protein